jgi:hypothetical protein
LKLEEFEEPHLVYFTVEMLKVIFHEICSGFIKRMKWAVKAFSEDHSRYYTVIP